MPPTCRRRVTYCTHAVRALRNLRLTEKERRGRADALCAGDLGVGRGAAGLGGRVLLIQQVPQLLVQRLDGAVRELHPARPLAVRLARPAARRLLLVARRLGVLRGLVRRTLGLRGDRPGLHGRGVGLLQDHGLVGGRQVSGGTGLLIGRVRLGSSSSAVIESAHVQRDGRCDGAAWNVRYHGDGGDARLFHRKEVEMAGGAGEFIHTGLRLLDPGPVNALVWRLNGGLRCRGQRGGGGGGGGGGEGASGGHGCDWGRRCCGAAVGPD
ncbi:hypothetical protein EYF80_041521 [Liparis tanakae]|uniref:Uncharacterized protein n=1 Tax=Liparis tanakae TaxID=230148 RepID=A0A4Z2G4S6_9TELE|nr:hypothetical protein EYF80_041521 [Liparis tanakae]